MKLNIITLLFCLNSFQLNAQNWNQVAKTVGSNRVRDNEFGYSVAISGDYAIIASINDPGNPTTSSGTADIFKNIGGTWTQIQRIVPSDSHLLDQFGFKVEIVGDYAFVGTVGTPTIGIYGRVYIFKNIGGVWIEVQKLKDPALQSQDNFGFSLTVSGDYLMVSSPNCSYDEQFNNYIYRTGKVYVYRNIAGIWTLVQSMVAPIRREIDLFGWSIKMSGDFAVIGTPYNDTDTNGNNSLEDAGCAYIYKNLGGTWTLIQKITAAHRESGSAFGQNVTIEGNNAVIGSFRNSTDENGNNYLAMSGSAYVFKNNNGVWTQVQKIVASDRSANDIFSNNVVINGDYLLVTACQDNDNEVNSEPKSKAGSAYVFKNNAGTWTQIQKIVASDRAANDRFGFSGAMSNEYILVGAPFEDEDANNTTTLVDAGSAYFFKINNTIPIELLSFEGQNRGKENILTWQTVSEYNNKGFFIERLKGNIWKEIGFVASNNRASIYEFIDVLTTNDLEATDKRYYYRLRQIDYNGMATLSKVISISAKVPHTLKIYPNVVKDFLTVETDNTDDFVIVNLLGQEVLRGKTAQRIAVSVLPQGAYLLRVGSEVAKFVKE
ncbi:MAG: T9SS type A sorting domain-containing protein [Saprospiraceae bacterium]|nr:T9SS type A sorting domain-containing protein [Saprospiraceae bacterium]